MTQQEAFEISRKKGVKLTHRFFTPDEHIVVRGATITTEEGYTMYTDEFMVYRQGEAWNKDWSVKP